MDDIAAGADTLEELFELLKALIECFDKAGIQVKASKLIFGVREISFHNYTISKDQTRPKDENLCPIRNMFTPRSVTELKAFLRLHATDEPILPVLWHSGISIALVDSHNGTVSEAMASGN